MPRFGRLVLALLSTAALATAQEPAPPAPGADQGLTTKEQRIGYVIGMQIAQSLGNLGKDIDPQAALAGLRDTLAGKAALPEAEAMQMVEQYQMARQMQAMQKMEQAGAANAEAATAFLAKNQAAEGVQTTTSGLQYQVLAAGEGKQPKATDQVTVHYRGTLLDGTQFDSSYDRGEPTSFRLNQVIPGWTEGLQLMKEGAKYRFWISPQLGYGPRPMGEIPPNSLLIFDVELIRVGG